MSQVYAPFIGGALTLQTSLTYEGADALLLINSLGNVVSFNTKIPVAGDVVHTIRVEPGGGQFAGSSAFVNGVFSIVRIDSGTHTGYLRGFQSQAANKGTSSQSGSGDFSTAGQHTAAIHDSTGTADEIRGNAAIATISAGGSVIACGAVQKAVGSVARFNYGSPTATGSCVDAIGVEVLTPTNTHATRTVTNLYGLKVNDQAGLAGVTNAYAIKTGTGLVDLGGRIQGAQGADIASANDMSIGADGNYYDVTGATQINTIVATNIKAGTMITLQFDSNPLVKHATAGAGSQLQLAGAVDFSSSAGDTLTLIFDGTFYREISRAVI